MANRNGYVSNYLLMVLIYFAISEFRVISEPLPSTETIEDWTAELSKKLKRDFGTTTGYELLKKDYNSTVTLKAGSKQLIQLQFEDMDTDQDYNSTATLRAGSKQLIQLQFEEMDADQVIRDTSKALSDMLDKKKDALRKAVTAAEAAASKYKWNSKITTEDVDYVSAKKIMENDTRLEENERFGQKIMPNISSVHIPVEIFDGDVEILNGLKWSADLDSAFKKNYDEDDKILWQYFGSQTGFMRTWPGSKWKTGPKEVDLYDVRRRPWYTQGSSSPKDMLILIDTSGSVFGQALELIKVSVKSLLDTLGENDFVNIATFSQEAAFVTPCFNGSFVQANYRNKKILMEGVDEIEAGGMANYQSGLTFAFEAFNKLNESDSRLGANCNRMIMLLTDGGSDYAKEVYDKYNPTPNQTYRVFTYAVGPTANPVGAITWMACRNRGYFSKIPAMGAIRSKVQGYVGVVSRPLALSSVDYELWTSIYRDTMNYMDFPVRGYETVHLPLAERYRYATYRDSWEYVPVISRPPAIKNEKEYKWGNVYVDVLGLGMMTTVTLPVYNKTAGSNNQTILGVMGVDVTTAEMMELIPRRQFGPNGFPFALNSNGYIVFHDGLKPQPGVKDPPNVDFLDVEVESEEKEKLRKAMIDQKDGTVIMDSLTILPDQRHVEREMGANKRTYYYRGIEGTTFSLGLSIPAFHKYYLKVTVDIRELMAEVRDILNASNTALMIANWEYYPDFLKSDNITGTVLDLEEALMKPDKFLAADRDLIYHLLWDLKATLDVGDNYWTLVKSSNSTREASVGMQGVFVGTNGGLTRIYPKSEDLVKLLKDQRDTWSTTYYKRAVDSSHYIFSAPYVPFNLTVNNGSVNNVMVVKSVMVENPKLDPRLAENPRYNAAVVGAVYSHQSMLDRLTGVTSGSMYGCDQPDTVACYLLDDGAFLMVTNQQQYNTSVGRFFGHVDPEIMRELYNKSVYERLEQFDYQGLCPVDEDGDSVNAGPSSFNIPSINLVFELLTFNWWTSVVTWMFTNLNLYSMLFSGQTQVYASTEGVKTKPCIKMHAMYYFRENLGLTEGQTEECEIGMYNCTRSFIAAPVKDTNLLLVVTEPMILPQCKICQSRIDKTELIQEPTKSLPDFCAIKPRYRRATDKCFDQDPREVTDKCAGSLTHPISYLLTGLVAVATTLLIHR